MSVCAACGQENPDGFRFCGSCGAPLVEASPPREQRKTVTVLFCDVTGSTALGEELDPETLRRTMGRYFEEIRRIVERHGGTVEKFIGDAVMAVFGIPVAHEDDALRAVRAAAEIRDRIDELGAELGVALSFRTGVNTGEVVAGEGETLVTGDAVNVAARLEQAATAGEVLIGAGTLALARDAVVTEALEPLEVKGKREPVAAHRLVSVDPTAEPFVRHLDTPLVGRIRERARLAADFEHAVSERTCHLFTLLGTAGVGKSRLVSDFLASVDLASADVLRSRCLHYGEDITYWPLVEILVALGIDPESVIGSSPAETQLSFRKLLEARAATRPQIVVFDDIQWAEAVFLDLIEHVADWARDAPIFLLCVARPELLEVRPGWGGGKLNATTILLEALSTDDCEQLVAYLEGDRPLSDDVRRRILRAADGNPLFIEEMLALASENGNESDLVVPPTIQALLQARLDRLAVGERAVIGRGAVEGQIFHRRTVQELAPERERDEIPAHLLSLVRKEMIRADKPLFTGDDAFRFRHLLIRDAAYDALPKGTRADLHERFADWLEHHGDLVELDEIMGYHLEQAHRNRAALDSSDPRLDALARRAADHLGRGGRAALTRGDLLAASGLFRRGAALLPKGDAQRLDLLIHLYWPLTQAGDVEEGRALTDELVAAEDERARTFGVLFAIDVDYRSGHHDWSDAESRIGDVRQTMERLDDAFGLTWVEWMQFAANWTRMQAEAAGLAAERGLRHAERAGAAHFIQDFTAWLGGTYQFGPMPVADVLPLVDSAVENARGPVELAGAQRRRGRVLAMVGAFDEGRAVHRLGVALSRDAGQLIAAAASGMGEAYIERRAGNHAAAEAALRLSAEELEALGDHAFHSTVCCELADLLLLEDKVDEAAAWCARAAETTNLSDLASVAHIEAIEGNLAARRGDYAEGERRARKALELLAESDFYDHGALMRLWLARTLALCGRPEQAREAAAEALAIYEAKGDEPAILWARDELDTLTV